MTVSKQLKKQSRKTNRKIMGRIAALTLAAAGIGFYSPIAKPVTNLLAQVGFQTPTAYADTTTEAPDYLPSPQRLNINPKTDNGVQIVSTSGGTLSSQFTGDGRGTSIVNYIWGTDMAADKDYNTYSSKSTYAFVANRHDAKVELKWPNAGTIDGKKVDVHMTVTGFNRVSNEYNGHMGLGIYSNFSDSVALFNDAAETKIWFTDASGKTVDLSGDNGKGKVYLTFGSLDAQALKKADQPKLSAGQVGVPSGRREFAEIDEGVNYLNKSRSHNTTVNLTGGARADGWTHAIATPSNWTSIGTDDWDSIGDWAYTRGVTFAPGTDTPTFYVGTTGTAGVAGDDGVIGDPRTSYTDTGAAWPSYNHLMISSSSSIPVHPQPKNPAPTKTVTDGGKVNLDGKTTNTKTKWVFNVSQGVPDMPYSQYYYDSFSLSDSVPATAKVSSSKVVNENGDDVTKLFTDNSKGQSIKYTATDAALQDASFYGHTYSVKIETEVNLDDQTKTAADLKTDNVGTSTINDKPANTNHVTVSPKFNDPSVKKTVSVDNGATWKTNATLKGHDSDYDYKVDYNISDHVEFKTLTLHDSLEDIQSVGAVKVVDATGKDVTGDWTISGLPTEGKNSDGKKAEADITLTAKDPSKYTRVGGTVSLLLSDVTLKGSSAAEDMNFYDASTKQIHIPNTASMNWVDTTPGSKEPGELKSNKTVVTPPTPINPENPKDPKTPIVTKQVSIDGGKTWSDPSKENPSQLQKHDDAYTWMTNFHVTNYFNFTGAGSLTLTDHFENLQKYDSIKIVQGADNNGQGGTDITDQFDISTKKVNGTKTDIVASVKAEDADNFDDIGGTKKADLANVKMIVTGSTVKGATGAQEVNYLTKDGNAEIPNQSTLGENDNVTGDYYARSKDSNRAWVRLPHVAPTLDKFVENDGDSSLLDAIDQEKQQEQATEDNSNKSSETSSSSEAISSSSVSNSSSSDNSQSSSSTVESKNSSSSANGSSTSSSSASVRSKQDASLTVNKAIDAANVVLARLDDKATPYPEAVQTALDKVVKVAGDTKSSSTDIQSAANELNTAIDAAIKDKTLVDATSTK